MNIFKKAVSVAVPAGLLTTALYRSDLEKISLFRTISARTISKIPENQSSFQEEFPFRKWNFDWDSRSPETLLNNDKSVKYTNEEEKKELLKAKTATAVRNVILIRHGQYEIDCYKRDVLTPLGREQATLIGQRLVNSELKFDKLTMSTMHRATETAQLILYEMPKMKAKSSSCCLIEEGAPYPPEPQHSTWKPDAARFYKEGGRIESAFRKHIHRADPSQKENSYEILVCHGNVIRYFVCRALQLQPEAWLRIGLANCSLTWLTIRPNGTVSIEALGDVGHLPRQKTTFN